MRTLASLIGLMLLSIVPPRLILSSSADDFPLDDHAAVMARFERYIRDGGLRQDMNEYRGSPEDKYIFNGVPMRFTTDNLILMRLKYRLSRDAVTAAYCVKDSVTTDSYRVIVIQLDKNGACSVRQSARTTESTGVAKVVSFGLRCQAIGDPDSQKNSIAV